MGRVAKLSSCFVSLIFFTTLSVFVSTTAMSACFAVGIHCASNWLRPTKRSPSRSTMAAGATRMSFCAKAFISISAIFCIVEGLNAQICPVFWNET